MNLKTYSEAWLKAFNDKESSMMQDALSDEFVWQLYG